MTGSPFLSLRLAWWQRNGLGRGPFAHTDCVGGRQPEPTSWRRRLRSQCHGRSSSMRCAWTMCSCSFGIEGLGGMSGLLASLWALEAEWIRRTCPCSRLGGENSSELKGFRGVWAWTGRASARRRLTSGLTSKGPGEAPGESMPGRGLAPVKRRIVRVLCGKKGQWDWSLGGSERGARAGAPSPEESPRVRVGAWCTLPVRSLRATVGVTVVGFSLCRLDTHKNVLFLPLPRAAVSN